MTEGFQKADGMNYAPRGKTSHVCARGDFRFAAIGLDHGHIYGMCNGLTEAGAELVSVYDPDSSKVERFCSTYPGVAVAQNAQAILDDRTVQMVASASVPVDRCALGLRVMEHGKDYFSDKPTVTTLEQLAQ